MSHVKLLRILGTWKLITADIMLWIIYLLRHNLPYIYMERIKIEAALRKLVKLIKKLH